MPATTPIPPTCKAACVHNPGLNFTVVIEDVPVPTPGQGEVLVRLSVTGICYSDIHYMLEDLPMPSMSDFGTRSPGHEGVGKIVAVGSGISAFNIGDRVGIKPIWSTCSRCELCCEAREMYCPGVLHTGIQKPGTYQHYLLAAAGHVIKIPSGLKDSVAAPILCSGATIYRGWVIISGAGGGVGHLGIQYARAMGMRVIAVDAGKAKKELCLNLGASEYIDFTETTDIAAKVVQITDGLGAHGVFVTASNAAAYRNLPAMLRVGGVIMCIGIPPPGRADAVGDPIAIIGKNLRVTGILVGTRHDVAKALDLAEQEHIRPIVEAFTLDKIQLAVDKLRSGNVNGRCIVAFECYDEPTAQIKMES